MSDGLDQFSPFYDSFIESSFIGFTLSPIAWAVILILILLFCLVLIRILWKKYRRNDYLRSAKKELILLSEESSTQGEDYLQFFSLLKRVSLIRFPEARTASLNGQDWYDFLYAQSYSRDKDSLPPLGAHYQNFDEPTDSEQFQKQINFALTWLRGLYV